MAFGCTMFLKSECDGCGFCEERRVPFDDIFDEPSGEDPYWGEEEE